MVGSIVIWRRVGRLGMGARKRLGGIGGCPAGARHRWLAWLVAGVWLVWGAGEFQDALKVHAAGADHAQDAGVAKEHAAGASQTPMMPMTQMTRPVGAVSMPAPVAGARPVYQAASTKKMAALLKSIYAGTDWRLDPSKPGRRVEYYRQMLGGKNLAGPLAGKLPGPLSAPDDAVVRLQLAKELLYAGDSEGSITTLEDLRKAWAGRGQRLPPDFARQVGEWLAISYLRLGEQENCSTMHGQKACIFPIRPEAAHWLPRGAEGAVRELSALLEANPWDTRSRWLLNVAYMQLGRYPGQVPARWLIPARLFASDEAMSEFPDIAASAGLDIMSHAGGAIVEDFDGDGLLDVMVSSSGPADQMHLFHNNGNGTFADVTEAAGLVGETGGLNIVLTDYNNDGRPDVLVLRGGWWGKQGCYPMSLLRNNGNGTFDDVTEAAGLLSLGPTQTAAWADYDNDGWLDLFVGHESKPDDPHPSQLFHNNHDGTFTEVGAASGLAELGFVKGVAWGDYNNDGRPDLYISVMYGRNRLFRNDVAAAAGGGWRFTDVTAAAGVAEQKNSFATWFFDYDNDGWPDIFVGGYSAASGGDVGAFEAGLPFQSDTPRLYHNNHDGTFTDVSKAVHLDRAILPMGANFGDIDNDGWLDVYLGTGDSEYQSLLPNRMFRNREGKSFADVTTAGGFGHLQKGHAIAFADLEGTGAEDVFEEMGGALPGDTYQSVLYHNPGNGNHWVTVTLEGVETNRAAFGARVDVALGARHIYRTVGYGSSFGGNPLRQHIGLGKAVRVDTLTVSWPGSRTTQRFVNVAGDASYKLREGGTLERVK
jgi:hypothetical protein